MRPLSQGQKAGGALSAEAERGRCHRPWLSSGVSCGWGLDQLADSRRKSPLESSVCDSGKTSGNMELCPVAPIRQHSLRDGVRGGWQSLVPLPASLSVAGGQGAPGHQDRARPSWPELQAHGLTPEAAWGLSLDSTRTWPLALRALSPLQPNQQPGILKSVLRFTPS